ncbi:MAG: hypothetical protein ACJ71P_08995, partial [Nitrososphaeraceae archaeon]
MPYSLGGGSSSGFPFLQLPRQRQLQTNTTAPTLKRNSSHCLSLGRMSFYCCCSCLSSPSNGNSG